MKSEIILTKPESFLEYIDRVPIDWVKWKLSHAFDNIGSGTTPKSDNPEYYDGIYPWVTTSELRESLINDTKQKLTGLALRDYSTLRFYGVESVLIAMYGATIGRIGMLGIKATVNQACCVFGKSTILDSKFFFYWLLMYRPVLLSLSTGGGQPNLNQDDLRKIKISVPSQNIQKSIASFLDQKTAQIDKLIAEKERLLKLLEEKRIALITRAVTKGLDPNVKMKPSGIDWLGDIPEHWEVKRLNHLASKIGDGIHTTPEYVDQSEYYFINGNNLNNGVIEISDTAKCVSEEEFNKYYTELKIGTILISINGTIGNIAYYNGENVIFGKSAAYIECKEYIQNELIYYILQSEYIKNYFEDSFSGTTIKNLSLETIRKMPIPISSIEEQKSIIGSLKKQIKKTEEIISKTLHAIELLKEYRISLITAAVTGKIDVRDFTPEEEHEKVH